MSWLKLSPWVSQPPLPLPPIDWRVIDRDEPHAGLDQPAGQQAALAVGRPAVVVAESSGSCERSNACLTLRRGQHRQGPRVEGVDPLGRVRPARAGRPARRSVRSRPRRSSSRSSGSCDGQAQLGKPEVGPVGVLADEERVVRLAQEARVLAGRDAAVAEHVRDRRRTLGSPGRPTGRNRATVLP